MPKNTTGGKGHKSGRNGESGIAKKNRLVIESVVDDVLNDEILEDIFVARVMRKLGSGRFDVFYFDRHGHPHQEQAVVRGAMRGRGKKAVFVEVNEVVIVHDNGLGGGSSLEIIAVTSPEQAARLRKTERFNDRIFNKTIENPADEPKYTSIERSDDLFDYSGTAEEEEDTGSKKQSKKEFIFEENAEIDVDAI
jgi:hypothetical protein